MLKKELMSSRHLNDLQLPSKVQIIQEAMISPHPKELAFDLATA